MFITLAAVAALSLAAPDWRDANAETSAISDAAGLDALAVDFPNSATIQRRILIQAFQAGDRERSIAALERLGAMGYGLSDAAFGQIAGVIGADAASQFHAGARWRRQPIGASRQVIELDPSILLAEAVVRDPVSGGFIIGSVTGRSLQRVADGGPTTRLDADLGSVFGLAVDEKRNLLWLASGKVDQTPDPDTAFVGLVSVNLETFEVQSRHAAPADTQSLNDIGIAPDGSVYAADATGGGIYRLAAGADTVEQVIAPNRLRGPQGIAISADGERAYLADYGYGIAMLDVVSETLHRLEAGAEVMLDGIDGLYWSEGSLVAIHNGIRPMQITRLDLDESGTRVTRQVTLERANPHWGEPTLGQVTDDQFLYVADPQWERFGKGGEVQGEAPLRPNHIRSIRIR